MSAGLHEPPAAPNQALHVRDRRRAMVRRSGTPSDSDIPHNTVADVSGMPLRRQRTSVRRRAVRTFHKTLGFRTIEERTIGANSLESVSLVELNRTRVGYGQSQEQ
jgi:hypothetical protein